MPLNITKKKLRAKLKAEEVKRIQWHKDRQIPIPGAKLPNSLRNAIRRQAREDSKIELKKREEQANGRD